MKIPRKKMLSVGAIAVLVIMQLRTDLWQATTAITDVLGHQPITNKDSNSNRNGNIIRGASSLSAVPRPPKKKSTKKKIWNYDEAAPAIQYAKTHFLSSIPRDHRVTFEYQAESPNNNTNKSFSEAFDDYASVRNNTFPHKMHFAEMNPTIAKLPERYLNDPEWLRAFGRSGSDDKDQDHKRNHKGGGEVLPQLPLYIATYRVTEIHNCFNNNHSLLVKFGNDYPDWNKRHRRGRLKSEYLGVALLDENLDIITDITVTLFGGIFGKKDYEDYRVFNLRGGSDSANGDEREQLYLSTFEYIVPIQLSLLSNNDNNTKPIPPLSDFLEIPPAFPSYVSSSKRSLSSPSFQLWARNYTSCAQGNRRAKNLMYFDKSTSTSPAKEMRVVDFQNPMRVHSVDLDQKCNASLKEQPPYLDALQGKKPPPARPSFDTMDKELFGENFGNDFLSGERGSGCCTRIQKNQIPAITTKTTPSGHNKTNNNNNDDDDDDTLLVAIVHHKTKPKIERAGGVKYMYLSRFIAFLPGEPYTVVARSGFFCLGNPSEEEMLGDNEEIPFDSKEFHKYFLKVSPLRMKNVTLPNCSRIHFVMGMIDKAKTNRNTNTHPFDSNGDTESESDSVIISYGISDCLSRFVEVKKADIIDMFYGRNQISLVE